MSSRFPPLVLAVLALLALLAACGGGGDSDPLTLDEYFTRLEALDAEFDRRNDVVAQQFDELFTDDAWNGEEQIELFQDTFAETTQIIGEFVRDLDEVDPPEEAAAAHAEAVATGKSFLAEMEAATDAIAEAADESAAFDAADAVFTSDAFDRFDATCSALQDIADEHGVAIDLDCEE